MVHAFASHAAEQAFVHCGGPWCFDPRAQHLRPKLDHDRRDVCTILGIVIMNQIPVRCNEGYPRPQVLCDPGISSRKLSTISYGVLRARSATVASSELGTIGRSCAR